MLTEYYVYLYTAQNELPCSRPKGIPTFISNNFISPFTSAVQGSCLFVYLNNA